MELTNQKNIATNNFFAVLLVPGLSYLIISLFLAFGYHVTSTTSLISLSASSLIASIIVGRRRFYIPLLYLLVILLSCLFLSSFFHDIYYDSKWYHSRAIISLSTGWNPFYDSYPANCKEPFINDDACFFIQHYPKASWIISSLFLSASGKLNSLFLFNFILLISAFIALYTYLSKKSFGLPFVFSLAAVFNPVVATQILSTYNDGALYCALLISFSSLMLYIETNRRLYLSAFILNSLIAANLKFTGLFYYVLFSAAFVLFFYKSIPKIALIYGTVFLFSGLFLTGFNPYITNYISNGHPFFPINIINNPDNTLSGDLIYLIKLFESQVSVDFQSLNRVYKFFLSTIYVPNEENRMNPDLIFSISSFFNNTLLDSRFSGFGRLYCLLLASSLLPLIISPNRYMICFLFLLFGSVFASEFSWWARLVPQAWLIPIIAWYFVKPEYYLLKRFFVLACLLNTILFTWPVIDNTFNKSAKVERRMTSKHAHRYSTYRHRFSFYNEHLLKERFPNIVYDESCTLKTQNKAFKLKGLYICSK